jgi:hypothetical protein
LIAGARNPNAPYFTSDDPNDDKIMSDYFDEECKDDTPQPQAQSDSDDDMSGNQKNDP